MPNFVSFLSGVLFGVGLVLSGMVLPEKVIAFLDVFGEWDPSLAFVMLGAIGVNAVVFRMIRNRSQPLFGGVFQLPTRRDLDGPLIAGAAVFGVGWGLAGFCPGPALTSLAGGNELALYFVPAMMVGMALGAFLNRKIFS